MYAVAACIIGSAVVNSVDPGGEAGFIRFAAEEINILLPHEVFSPIKWIVRLAIVDGGKRSISVLAELTELPCSRTEVVIQPRWRQDIEAILFNVLEMVEPVGISNR